MSSAETIRGLLIDDDQAAMLLTTAILNKIPESSFELEWAATYEEGRERVAKNEHDVYLVDYHLDGESGTELVREARALQNRAPMILITGKGRYEIDVEAMEAGVSDYLEKGTSIPTPWNGRFVTPWNVCEPRPRSVKVRSATVRCSTTYRSGCIGRLSMASCSTPTRRSCRS
jgi:CheY-like chemotaxis protein